MSHQDDGVTNINEPIRLKQITRRQLLDDLQSFSREFKKLDPKITISTPQADRGIGPVQYTLNLPRANPVDTGRLRILSKMIELEKFKGDALIKLDASLLFLATGIEDPVGFLPPGCRAATRIEMQEATSKLNDKLKLSWTHATDHEILNGLIDSAEKLLGPANPAEIALICDAVKKNVNVGRRQYWVPQSYEFTYAGIKRTMAKHRREKAHIRRMRFVLDRVFALAAVRTVVVSKYAKKTDSDDTADDEQENPGTS